MIAPVNMKRNLAFSFAFIMAMFMVAQLFVGPERTVQSVKDATHKCVQPYTNGRSCINQETEYIKLQSKNHSLRRNQYKLCGLR
jgi:hypothetical protein